MKFNDLIMWHPEYKGICTIDDVNDKNFTPFEVKYDEDGIMSLETQKEMREVIHRRWERAGIK